MTATSPIDQLRQGLTASLPAPGSLFARDEIEKLRQTVERIRKEIGDRPTTPAKALICAALDRLRGASALDGAQFYFACWGLTERCENHPPLIEDERHFPTLMIEIRQREPRTLLWLGLLDAYFRCERDPGQPVGEKHWKVLRDWLKLDLKKLCARTKPELLALLSWINVLGDNQNLFGNTPCRPYAEAALRGDFDRIKRIESALGIPETSWFWRELLMSQIEHAIGCQELDFKAGLNNLLDQLVKRPALRDEGLSTLLTRYADCADTSAHEGLKRSAIEAWGGRPEKWPVSRKVKEMVSQWLVLEDLEDFFQRLQAGGLADKRRLAFWLRLIKQISYSHIALGSQLSSSWNPDWVEFRKKKRGRISQMWGGDGTKNAFIMKIGAYYFVEFSKNGDACYGYEEGQEPFSFDAGDLFYPSSLKDKKRRTFWGSHAGDWEHRFLTGSNNQLGLSSNLGIYPDL